MPRGTGRGGGGHRDVPGVIFVPAIPPRHEAFAQWKADNGKPEAATIAELRDDPALRAEIQAAVDHANKAVSHAEAIKKFAILDADFTEADGQLTPTMKVRRYVVMEQYAAEIAALYEAS